MRLLAAACLFAPSVPTALTAADKPPNIVFFLVDDLGWSDIGVFGSTFHETPNNPRKPPNCVPGFKPGANPSRPR